MTNKGFILWVMVILAIWHIWYMAFENGAWPS